MARMRVVLIGMYPTEAFGMAPLVLKAGVLAHPALADSEVVLRFCCSDAHGHYPVSEMLQDVAALAPDVVGISCYMWNRAAVIELARGLKAQLGQTLLVVGGPEVETPDAAASVLRDGNMDVAIRGEGELRFPALLVQHRDGQLPDRALPGISYRSGAEMIHLPDAPPIDPLDQIPTAFDPTISGFRGITRIPCFETYRGCKMRCKFCNWGKARGGVRFFGLERICRDLDFILGLDIERIWFVDSVFNLDKEHAKQILHYLRAHNHKNIRFDFEMMAELLDDEQIDLIAQFPAGSTIAFGLQSTDPEVVREALRPHNWRRFTHAIREVRQRAPQVEVTIDLIYGLPRDRPEKFKRSILDAADLDPTRILSHPFRVLVGTQFHDDRARYGFRVLGDREYGISAEQGISEADVDEFKWLSYWCLLYNSPRFRRTIDGVHHRSGVPRSVILESFAQEYEQILGRTYWWHVEPGDRPGWEQSVKQAEHNLLSRYDVSTAPACP